MSGSDTLQLRVAALEWSLRSGRGETRGLGWVDTELLARGRPFTVVSPEVTGTPV